MDERSENEQVTPPAGEPPEKAEESTAGGENEAIRRAQEAVAHAEASGGADSMELALKLEELARLLRLEPGRLLDAVNIEARARVIRQKHLQSELTDSSAGVALAQVVAENKASRSKNEKPCPNCKQSIARDALLCVHCLKYAGGKPGKGLVVVGVLLFFYFLSGWLQVVGGTAQRPVWANVELLLPFFIFASAGFFVGRWAGAAMVLGISIVLPALVAVAGIMNVPPLVFGIAAGAVAVMWARSGTMNDTRMALVLQGALGLAVLSVFAPAAFKFFANPLIVLVALACYALGGRKLGLITLAISATILLGAISVQREMSVKLPSVAGGTKGVAVGPRYVNFNADNPGEQMELGEAIVRGKTTIIFFHSANCGPCRVMEPLLEQLAEARSDLAVSSIDIDRPGSSGIDWDSPLAEQYQIHSVPSFRIYRGDGSFVSQGGEAKQTIRQWMSEKGITR